MAEFSNLSKIAQIAIGDTDYAVLDADGRSFVTSDFSASTTYAYEDYCVYNDSLYKCTNTSGHTGAWASADFTAVNIGDELNSIRNDIPSGEINLLFNGTKAAGTNDTKLTNILTQIGSTETNYILSSTTEYIDCSGACLTFDQQNLPAAVATTLANVSPYSPIVLYNLNYQTAWDADIDFTTASAQTRIYKSGNTYYQDLIVYNYRNATITLDSITGFNGDFSGYEGTTVDQNASSNVFTVTLGQTAPTITTAGSISISWTYKGEAGSDTISVLQDVQIRQISLYSNSVKQLSTGIEFMCPMAGSSNYAVVVANENGTGTYQLVDSVQLNNTSINMSKFTFYADDERTSTSELGHSIALRLNALDKSKEIQLYNFRLLSTENTDSTNRVVVSTIYDNGLSGNNKIITFEAPMTYGNDLYTLRVRTAWGTYGDNDTAGFNIKYSLVSVAHNLDLRSTAVSTTIAGWDGTAKAYTADFNNLVSIYNSEYAQKQPLNVNAFTVGGYTDYASLAPTSKVLFSKPSSVSGVTTVKFYASTPTFKFQGPVFSGDNTLQLQGYAAPSGTINATYKGELRSESPKYAWTVTLPDSTTATIWSSYYGSSVAGANVFYYTDESGSGTRITIGTGVSASKSSGLNFTYDLVGLVAFKLKS